LQFPNQTIYPADLRAQCLISEYHSKINVSRKD